MYVTTRAEVGQAPMLSSFFSGTLGDGALPKGIQDFLNELHNHPDELKKLILTVMFHPNPVQTWLTFGPKKTNLNELLLMNGLSDKPVDFNAEVGRIGVEFQKKYPSFRQQIEAEKQLFDEMLVWVIEKINAGQEKKLKPYYVAHVLMQIPRHHHAELAWQFAKNMFPTALVERIKKSAIHEAHLLNLGMFLRKRGKKLLDTKDSEFKQLHEQELNKRKQERLQEAEKAKAEAERKRRERRRRRK